MKLLIKAVLFLALTSTHAMSSVLVEDFEASFPTWESAWLGSNSNLQNYYGVGGGRGNNPDGLWIADGLNNGSISEINFESSFGASINEFSIDVTTWINGATFEAFDMNGVSLVNTVITVMRGAYTDPGVYQNISFNSQNGVSGFKITGGSIEGSTSIDNVIVNTGPVNVPEPSTLLMLGLGMLGFSVLRKKKAA